MDDVDRSLAGRIVLLFDRSSYRTSLLLLRECVRCHQRLPDALVMDGGPEFRHACFEIFCVRCGCMMKTRPAPRPYFGSIIEKMFGATDTQIFRNLDGSAHMLKMAEKIPAAARGAVPCLGIIDEKAINLVSQNQRNGSSFFSATRQSGRVFTQWLPPFMI